MLFSRIRMNGRDELDFIYQQTVIDTYTKVVFAKLYDRKNAISIPD